MNTFSLVTMLLVGLLISGFTVLLLAAIIFNLKTGQKFRQKLAQDLHKLRLAKMLSALGIDINSYLHTARSIDIYQQMNRCAACENTRECDESLAQEDIEASKIDFCNNEQSLQELVRNRPAPVRTNS